MVPSPFLPDRKMSCGSRWWGNRSRSPPPPPLLILVQPCHAKAHIKHLYRTKLRRFLNAGALAADFGETGKTPGLPTVVRLKARQTLPTAVLAPHCRSAPRAGEACER